jgi:hypothetical protein
MPGLDRSFVNANRHDPPLKDPPQPELNREQIVAACNASLRRLQTNFIDLYLIHWCGGGLGIAFGRGLSGAAGRCQPAASSATVGPHCAPAPPPPQAGALRAGVWEAPVPAGAGAAGVVVRGAGRGDGAAHQGAAAARAVECWEVAQLADAPDRRGVGKPGAMLCPRHALSINPAPTPRCPPQEGKIREWGVSNETTFGVCRMAEAAKRLGVKPPVSIQNDGARAGLEGP